MMFYHTFKHYIDLLQVYSDFWGNSIKVSPRFGLKVIIINI